MGRQLVVDAVAGQEGDPPTLDRADGDGRRRCAVGRVHRHLDDVVEELVEPGAADDPQGRPGVAQEAAAGVEELAAGLVSDFDSDFFSDDEDDDSLLFDSDDDDDEEDDDEDADFDEPERLSVL
jgi:hypothetical protein